MQSKKLVRRQIGQFQLIYTLPMDPQYRMNLMARSRLGSSRMTWPNIPPSLSFYLLICDIILDYNKKNCFI